MLKFFERGSAKKPEEARIQSSEVAEENIPEKETPKSPEMENIERTYANAVKRGFELLGLAKSKKAIQYAALGIFLTGIAASNGCVTTMSADQLYGAAVSTRPYIESYKNEKMSSINKKVWIANQAAREEGVTAALKDIADGKFLTCRRSIEGLFGDEGYNDTVCKHIANVQNKKRMQMQFEGGLDGRRSAEEIFK